MWVKRVMKRLIPFSGMEDEDWEIVVIDDPCKYTQLNPPPVHLHPFLTQLSPPSHLFSPPN